MASLNKVQLIGNLGADPEYMVAQGGFAVTKFRVATTEKFKDKSGEMREETEWHRVVLFGSLADIANRFLKKGSQVYIEGRIKTSSYDKDGEKRYATDIIGSSMQMLGSRQGGSDSQVTAKDSSSNYYSQPDVDTTTNDDDDIPF